MALYDTEPLNTRNGPISDLLLHCYIVTFTSAQFGLLADGAKDKETLESEDMDTWPEPENREMHVGHEWSIESFYSCWFDTTQVGTGRLLLEMHMHFRYIFLLYIYVYIYILYCYQCWYHVMQLYYSDFRWEIWVSILGAPSSIALSYLYTVDSLKSQCGVRVDLSRSSKFDPYFQCIQMHSGQAVSEVHVLQTWKHWGAALQWSSDKVPWLPKIRWCYQDW